MSNTLHFLLIGPLPKPKADKVGGARVSFQQLVDYMRQQPFSYQLIETQPYSNGWKKILNPFQLLLQFFLRIVSVDIVWLNVSQKGTRFLAPLLYWLSKLFGKQFILRPFGSSLQDDYQIYSNWQKKVFQKTALQADILFLQTHSAIRFFTPLAKNIKHLPTSRPLPLKGKKEGFQRRFIFLGHLKVSKGIEDIIATANQLGDGYQIHLYGPIMDKELDYLQTQNSPYYQGVLQQEEVTNCLRNYDVLLLPTYFSGEGYPGAIIEAYSHGLPVITTKWKAIPEIVEDGKTGLLIEDRNLSQLAAAIQAFNTENYKTFSDHALQYFHKNFEQKNVLKQALKQITITCI